VRRSASLLGILGLVFLAFGFVAAALVGVHDWYVRLNVIVGAALVVAYLAFGFEDFRTVLGRRSTRYGAGAALYTLLFVLLVVGGNYLSWRHHHRWDVTEAGVYTLSPQSRKVVEALGEDLAMTAFVEGGMDPQLETLLGSYQYAAPRRITLRMVDPDEEPALVEQMKITTARSVNLQYGKESFVVTNPAEESLTNGIIRVSGSKKKVVYFGEGHGEADLQNQEDPKGYWSAKLALEQENYEVKTLVLPATETIPEDASVLVLAGPARAFSAREIEMVDAYLKRAGHLLLLVGANQADGQLAPFLQGWGVKLGADVVIDRELRLFEGPRLGVVPIVRTYGSHPITQGFRDITIFPQTRTVEPDAAVKKGLRATALARTSTSSWAETSVEDVFTKNIAQLDGTDRPGPLTVAVAVEATLSELGVERPAGPTARLVVFGSSLFADNQQLVQSPLNGDFFLNAVGWLVGQEELVSIRTASVRASRAVLTRAQAIEIFYLSVLIVPQLLIASGIAVWWRRKSQ
jgi:ABC-type uncharacterized transport system involved in gliding motility auxiliary subunit